MAESPGRVKKILIVEDEPATRALMHMLFDSDRATFGKCEVLDANDGSLALDIAARDLPDLIIMDIMMPDISGLEAIKTLRADPKTQNIPILICTAKKGLSDAEKGRAAGANDYLAKPFSNVVFKEKVKKLLNLAVA